MTGLRPGELLGLRWEDVDFAAGVIRVRKCLKALPDPATGGRRLVLEDLKTERSRRTIQMPRQVVEVLLALRKEQAALKLRLGTAYDVRGLVIVFGDRAGAPRWPQDVRRYFKALCGRAGIGESWTPREQRHTFVSVLSDSGVDIEQIADAVGHINSTVTKTTYRHQIADKITAAATVMDAVFRGDGPDVKSAIGSPVRLPNSAGNSLTCDGAPNALPAHGIERRFRLVQIRAESPGQAVRPSLLSPDRSTVIQGRWLPYLAPSPGWLAAWLLLPQPLQ